jgi:uncharacterized integral membrane protein
MTQFLISLVVAIWVSAIALLAIQNATPVSLQFLNIQSVEIPLGLVMAFSASIGMIGAALSLGIWRSARSRT